jgi:hypothetical protein
MIEATSDIPYLDDPRKMFAYLDGYHYAVKNGDEEVSELLKCWPQRPRVFPSEFYEEGFRAGAKDSKVISDQLIKEGIAAAGFIQSQLETYIQMNKDKDTIIQELTQELAVVNKKLRSHE